MPEHVAQFQDCDTKPVRSPPREKPNVAAKISAADVIPTEAQAIMQTIESRPQPLDGNQMPLHDGVPIVTVLDTEQLPRSANSLMEAVAADEHETDFKFVPPDLTLSDEERPSSALPSTIRTNDKGFRPEDDHTRR